MTRFPKGYQAALVLTDHADQSNAARLEAVAFGRTGALKAKETGPKYPGLVNRGLSYSKTIFLEKAPRVPIQFEAPAFRRVLDMMHQKGVEIGLHSVTGWRDPPDQVKRLLPQFRDEYPGRTWIDHEPQTNCEAISNKGWSKSSRWYVMQNLADHGFRYLWNIMDLYLPPGTLNMLAPGRPASRRPILYPYDRFGPPNSFVLFSSTWTYLKRERFLKLLSEDALDALQRERGLHVGHVYLESFRRDNKRLMGKSLVEPDGEGGYRLLPEVDALFARLQRRQQRGELWVAGIEAVADHLLGAFASEIHYLPDGAARIVGPAGQSLWNVTLHLPAPGATVTVDGKPPKGRRVRGGTLEVWFDVPKGRARVLKVTDRRGRPLPFARPVKIRLIP